MHNPKKEGKPAEGERNSLQIYLTNLDMADWATIPCQIRLTGKQLSAAMLQPMHHHNINHRIIWFSSDTAYNTEAIASSILHAALNEGAWLAIIILTNE